MIADSLSNDEKETISANTSEYAKNLPWCVWCLNSYANNGSSCPHCKDTYRKLKACGQLPRRREAILATKEKRDGSR